MLRTINVLEYVKKMYLFFVPKMRLFIRPLVLIHPNKMKLLNTYKHSGVAKTVMIHMSVPKYLWSDAVLSARHLINMMPSFVLNKKSPFSCLYPNKTPFFMTSHVLAVLVSFRTCLLG